MIKYLKKLFRSKKFRFFDKICLSVRGGGGGGGGGEGVQVLFLMEHMPKSTQRVGGCISLFSKSTHGNFLSQKIKLKEGYPKQYLKSTMVLF